MRGQWFRGDDGARTKGSLETSPKSRVFVLKDLTVKPSRYRRQKNDSGERGVLLCD